MNETRNFIMVLLLVAGLVWGVIAWVVLADDAALFWVQRIGSLLLIISMAGWLFYALKLADKLPDHMSGHVGEMYYVADGVAFMPTVRARKGQGELCVYYQNAHENPAEVIVHLRPPDDSFIIKPGMRDVHFAFKAGGGDFGVIHQPIAVPEHLQGEVIEVELAAASHYPRSHGARLRRATGLPCGSLMVDWGGSVFRSGVHEVSGEIDLHNPVKLHFTMPQDVAAFDTGHDSWRQECLSAGPRI